MNKFTTHKPRFLLSKAYVSDLQEKYGTPNYSNTQCSLSPAKYATLSKINAQKSPSSFLENTFSPYSRNTDSFVQNTLSNYISQKRSSHMPLNQDPSNNVISLPYKNYSNFHAQRQIITNFRKVPLQNSQGSLQKQLGSLEYKSICTIHRYINEFYCVTCERDICSHCSLLSGFHQNHETMHIKEYINKMKRNLDNYQNECKLVRDDLMKKKTVPNVLIQDRMTEIDQIIDIQIEKAIEQLQKLKNGMKERYMMVCKENIQGVEDSKKNLLRETKKAQVVEQLFNKAIEEGQASEIIEFGKALSAATFTFNSKKKKYRKVKKECQNVRENLKLQIFECCQKIENDLSKNIEDELQRVDEFDCTQVLKFEEDIKSSIFNNTERTHQPRKTLSNQQSKKKVIKLKSNALLKTMKIDLREVFHPKTNYPLTIREDEQEQSSNQMSPVKPFRKIKDKENLQSFGDDLRSTKLNSMQTDRITLQSY